MNSIRTTLYAIFSFSVYITTRASLILGVGNVLEIVKTSAADEQICILGPYVMHILFTGLEWQISKHMMDFMLIRQEYRQQLVFRNKITDLSILKIIGRFHLNSLTKQNYGKE